MAILLVVPTNRRDGAICFSIDFQGADGVKVAHDKKVLHKENAPTGRWTRTQSNTGALVFIWGYPTVVALSEGLAHLRASTVNSFVPPT